MDSKKNAPTLSSRDFRKEVVAIHKSAQADSKKKVDSNNDYSASAECMDCHATASAVSRNDRNNAPILKTPAKDSRIFDTNAASEKADSSKSPCDSKICGIACAVFHKF